MHPSERDYYAQVVRLGSDSPSTAYDYAAAPPFIRAASRCVGFVKGYHSMWLQPAEHRTQPATAPVKACGKKVCRLVILLLLTLHS